MNKTWKKINQRACYNRIWSWSPVPCEKHGPRASVTTKTSAFGLGFCLLSPSGHVFHTARETMIKSYNMILYITRTTALSIIAVAMYYNDLIMSTMVSQFTSLMIVYSLVYSDTDQRKHQSPTSLAFVRGIHQWPVNSLHKRVSKSENVSIWWCHHGLPGKHAPR